MTETKQQRPGRDFAIGFFGSILLATGLFTLAGILSFGSHGTTVDKIGIITTIAGIGFVVVAPILSFIYHRKFIGIGILTALVAVPLLLIGSCYTIFQIGR